MRLDNSAFSAYMKCPKLYWEKYEARDFLSDSLLSDVAVGPYVRGGNSLSELVQITGALSGGETRPDGGIVGPGLQLRADRSSLQFGTRFHQLSELSHRSLLGLEDKVYPELADGQLESECQATWARYEAHYIGDPLRILETEKTSVIKIPETPHELIVKIDDVVGFGDGSIGPKDIKTEGTPGHNFRENWAGRTQASLYLWALTQLHPGEKVSRLVVDVVTRGTPKRSPTFYRVDDISRTPGEQADAIRNVARVCDEIERHRREGWWPSNMNICKDSWRKCDFYELHVLGRTEANLRLYEPAEQYLDV